MEPGLKSEIRASTDLGPQIWARIRDLRSQTVRSRVDLGKFRNWLRDRVMYLRMTRSRRKIFFKIKNDQTLKWFSKYFQFLEKIFWCSILEQISWPQIQRENLGFNPSVTANKCDPFENVSEMCSPHTPQKFILALPESEIFRFKFLGGVGGAHLSLPKFQKLSIIQRGRTFWQLARALSDSVATTTNFLNPKIFWNFLKTKNWSRHSRHFNLSKIYTKSLSTDFTPKFLTFP